MIRTAKWYLGSILCAWTMYLLVGCQQSIPQPTLSQQVPVDFSVSIRVVNSTQPGTNCGCYLLQPDRSFHQIENISSIIRTYPPRIRMASPSEVDKVYRIVQEHNLLAEPTSPMAKNGGTTNTDESPHVLYYVELTAMGRTCQYVTTAAESPATARLLLQMRELGSARPTRG